MLQVGLMPVTVRGTHEESGTASFDQLAWWLLRRRPAQGVTARQEAQGKSRPRRRRGSVPEPDAPGTPANLAFVVGWAHRAGHQARRHPDALTGLWGIVCGGSMATMTTGWSRLRSAAAHAIPRWPPCVMGPGVSEGRRAAGCLRVAMLRLAAVPGAGLAILRLAAGARVRFSRSRPTSRHRRSVHHVKARRSLPPVLGCMPSHCSPVQVTRPQNPALCSGPGSCTSAGAARWASRSYSPAAWVTACCTTRRAWAVRVVVVMARVGVIVMVPPLRSGLVLVCGARASVLVLLLVVGSGHRRLGSHSPRCSARRPRPQRLSPAAGSLARSLRSPAQCHVLARGRVGCIALPRRGTVVRAARLGLGVGVARHGMSRLVSAHVVLLFIGVVGSSSDLVHGAASASSAASRSSAHSRAWAVWLMGPRPRVESCCWLGRRVLPGSGSGAAGHLGAWLGHPGRGTVWAAWATSRTSRAVWERRLEQAALWVRAASACVVVVLLELSDISGCCMCDGTARSSMACSGVVGAGSCGCVGSWSSSTSRCRHCVARAWAWCGHRALDRHGLLVRGHPGAGQRAVGWAGAASASA
jgi:hypothetical protein